MIRLFNKLSDWIQALIIIILIFIISLLAIRGLDNITFGHNLLVYMMIIYKEE